MKEHTALYFYFKSNDKTENERAHNIVFILKEMSGSA